MGKSKFYLQKLTSVQYFIASFISTGLGSRSSITNACMLICFFSLSQVLIQSCVRAERSSSWKMTQSVQVNPKLPGKKLHKEVSVIEIKAYCQM